MGVVNMSRFQLPPIIVLDDPGLEAGDNVGGDGGNGGNGDNVGGDGGDGVRLLEFYYVYSCQSSAELSHFTTFQSPLCHCLDLVLLAP